MRSLSRHALRPRHGFTRSGLAVHAKVWDHHPVETAYQRFNKRMALWIVGHVGTMTCTWLFFLLALVSLPATLVIAHVVPGTVFVIGGLYLASAGLVGLVSWTAQSFLQLILLPAIMVGQNIQNEASDARAAKTFEDVTAMKENTAQIIDQLRLDTEGGLKTLRDDLLAAIDGDGRRSGR